MHIIDAAGPGAPGPKFAFLFLSDLDKVNAVIILLTADRLLHNPGQILAASAAIIALASLGPEFAFGIGNHGHHLSPGEQINVPL
jgi:hypothetical protein